VGPGKFNTKDAHISDAKISAVERGAEYLLSRAARIGAEAGRWARAMLEERGIEGVRVLQGFVGLAKKHPPYAINHASSVALRSNLFRLRPLKELIKRTTRQAELEFLEEHEIIRPLSEYQEMITVSFKPQHKEAEDNEPATGEISQTASPVRYDIDP